MRLQAGQAKNNRTFGTRAGTISREQKEEKRLRKREGNTQGTKKEKKSVNPETM